MRNQTALEYLIIIAAVIAVSAIVVVLVTGSAGTSQKGVLYSSCKQAALQCELLHKTNPNDPCVVCNESCVDPRNGQELEQCIIRACQLGNISMIYEGANISFGTCSADAECDDGNACTIDSCVPFNGDECNKTCNYTQITQCINDDGCCPPNSGCNHNNDNDCGDNPPTLTNAGVTPSSGLTIDGANSNNHDGTLFTFTVTYADPDNDAPNYVRVNIDGVDYDMTSSCTDYASGCVYSYSRKFSAPSASHSYYFKTASAASSEITSPTGSVVAYVCSSDSNCHADTTCRNYYCNYDGTASAVCTWSAQNEGASCATASYSCDTSKTTDVCPSYAATVITYYYITGTEYVCSSGSCVSQPVLIDCTKSGDGSYCDPANPSSCSWLDCSLYS